MKIKFYNIHLHVFLFSNSSHIYFGGWWRRDGDDGCKKRQKSIFDNEKASTASNKIFSTFDVEECEMRWESSERNFVKIFKFSYKFKT